MKYISKCELDCIFKEVSYNKSNTVSDLCGTDGKVPFRNPWDGDMTQFGSCRASQSVADKLLDLHKLRGPD